MHKRVNLTKLTAELADLRTEVERQRKTIRELESDLDSIVDHRAENEQLRAEVERLKNENSSLIKDLDEEQAEADRLRPVVEEFGELADFQRRGVTRAAVPHLNELWKAATEALDRARQGEQDSG